MPTLTENELYAQVDEALELIRPAIQADGGDVDLLRVDADTGTAYVQMVGACVGCSMSEVTLKMGIENAIRSQVPEIYEVEAV